MLDYVSAAERLPPNGERVLTIAVFEDGDYTWCAARLTVYGWRDDQSKPVRRVTYWARVVSPDEMR
jgi:hypothetical protein